ncbi:MAG: site-specific DNA-methyltransferase [Candidatus Magnetoovum sp. WYHC-5]|nr:site-specific DNA-methyltransferase [Candidatus Magnetoovum sp. WYHC-5]
MTDKINGESLDISAENRARLKQLFPAVFTETVNDKGILTESIDFEKLKAELGVFTELFENRRERYGMDWSGKKDTLRLIQTPSTATLKPCREESVSFDETANLFIEGDNLEVLKLLQKSYYGKVKMIYIDPPYNTGKEFIYPDNFTETLQTYLDYAGLTDGNGKKFSTNTENEGRFHTKWLNMMYPRLYLARNLLRDDGVIFISIDDNEVSNLRKLCDEIFGEENFIVNIIWQHSIQPKGYVDNVSIHHNYILCYQKSDNFRLMPLERTEEHNINYSNPDNDVNGSWRSGDVRNALYRPNLIFEIITPSGKIIKPPINGWRWSKETINKKIDCGEIIFNTDETKIIRKIYLKDVKGRPPESIWCGGEVGTTRSAVNELKLLFDGSTTFDTAKPTKLIIKIIQLVCNIEKKDIILDFFAGSCTTAHAVLDLNKQDGGNRKFIMVQLPEPCAPDSEAFKAGYKTISDIGKERIRRVIKKLNEANEGKLNFENTTLQDRGFRAFKLDKSNFKQWQKLDRKSTPEEIEKQLFEHVDHINHKSTPEDLLYEILLKAGFQPTIKVSILTIAGKQVFSIAEGALLICLEKEVTEELIDAVIDENPQQFICLDAAFGGNDQLKVNTAQKFTASNMQKEKYNQIIFKTV